MQKVLKNTAILVFSHSAQIEAERKVFLPGRSSISNRKVTAKLLQDTLKTARKSGFPVELVLSDEQSGENFGERLANALESVFDKGFERVICIGNDTQHLVETQLVEANQALDQDQLVLGPAEDGGVYLIGLNRENYSREAFLSIGWETDTVQQDWRDYQQGLALTARWFAEKADLDTANDFNEYLRSLAPHHSLKRLVKSILASQRSHPFHLIANLISIPFTGPSHLRAPPVLCDQS